MVYVHNNLVSVWFIPTLTRFLHTLTRFLQVIVGFLLGFLLYSIISYNIVFFFKEVKVFVLQV